MDFENKFDYGIEADFGGLLDGDKWSEVLEAMQRGLEKVKECGLIKWKLWVFSLSNEEEDGDSQCYCD